MATLCVNIDHVATLRQARGGTEPEPVLAALQAELAGSTGVTLHVREDRRHIQDRDARLIRSCARGHVNLEMAATDAMIAFALDLKPDIVTLVPERREELTTEGGLDVKGGGERLRRAVDRLKAGGMAVSLFIDADPEQIRASAESGAGEVELHTGPYSHAKSREGAAHCMGLLAEAGRHVRDLGLVLNAGHGLNYHNVGPVAAIEGMAELNIGHAIVARAVFDGWSKAVSDMARLVAEASRR